MFDAAAPVALRCPPRMPSLPGRRSASTYYAFPTSRKEFALTTRAIRFYEDEGLLAPLRRGQHARLRRARARRASSSSCAASGWASSLSEIRELLDLYDDDAATSGRSSSSSSQMLADRRAMLEQQREDIDAVLAEIDALERECRQRLSAGPREGALARMALPKIDVYVNVRYSPRPAFPNRLRRPVELAADTRSKWIARRSRLRGRVCARASPARARCALLGATLDTVGAGLLRDRARSRGPRCRSSTATSTRASSRAIADSAGGYAGFTLFPRGFVGADRRIQAQPARAGARRSRSSPRARSSSPGRTLAITRGEVYAEAAADSGRWSRSCSRR